MIYHPLSEAELDHHGRFVARTIEWTDRPFKWSRILTVIIVPFAVLGACAALVIGAAILGSVL